jgi:hypothetical protein
LRCEAKEILSSTPSSTAETTKVRCRTTYQRILSFAICWASMKIRSRWIDEIATIEMATLSFSVPESIFESQAGASLPASWSMRETKFS